MEFFVLELSERNNNILSVIQYDNEHYSQEMIHVNEDLV